MCIKYKNIKMDSTDRSPPAARAGHPPEGEARRLWERVGLRRPLCPPGARENRSTQTETRKVRVCNQSGC